MVSRWSNLQSTTMQRNVHTCRQGKQKSQIDRITSNSIRGIHRENKRRRAERNVKTSSTWRADTSARNGSVRRLGHRRFTSTRSPVGGHEEGVSRTPKGAGPERANSQAYVQSESSQVFIYPDTWGRGMALCAHDPEL